MRVFGKRPRRLGRRDSHRPGRRDVHVIPVQADVEFHVFWKKLEIGRGPTASLYVLGDEVLRVDCFGDGLGHLHAELLQRERAAPRLYLSEPTQEAQVDRAVFELTRNLAYYLERNPRRAIRRFEIDPEALGRACHEARGRMLGFLAANPELRAAPPPP